VAVSVAVCEIFNYSVLKNGMTLKTRLGVVQGHWKWHHSTDHMRFSIGRPL